MDIFDSVSKERHRATL